MWLFKRVKDSIGLQVLLYLSLPTITIFSIFTSVSGNYLKDASERNYRSEARTIVKAHKVFVSPEDITNPARFQRIAEKIVQVNSQIDTVHLHLKRGNKVYNAVSTRHGEIGKISPSTYAKPLYTNKDLIVREGSILEIHAPIRQNGKPVGVIGIYLSTAAEQNRLNRLLVQLLLVGIGAFGLIGLVMYLILSRTVLHPISRLERSTKKLALGNYERVNIDREDELGQLARHFNDMLTTVASKEDETKALYSKLESSYRRARNEAITDELTGLYNYRYFRSRLSEELDRTDRKGTPVSLAFIDIDNFKSFNDDFGHQAGDEAIIRVADIIKSIIRSHDLAARYGGEELVVIFPETDLDQSFHICERIRTEVKQSLIQTGISAARLSVSIGLAVYPENARTLKQLIQAADFCMYEAKKRGKNLVVTADIIVDSETLKNF